jgi:LacI family repressor for deo operon, udp, cdd, tsx, nupC, and nupG
MTVRYDRKAPFKSSDRPTLNEVASRAGVSVATASRALSNPELVAERTRHNVRKAAEACGYRVNFLARSLRRERSDSILVLIPDIDNFFYPEIIRALEETAHGEGLSMMLGLTSNRVDRESSYLDVLSSRRADGLIILDGGLDRMMLAGVEFDVPTVQVLECAAGKDLPTVRIDDRLVAELAVAHLAGLGHRHIAHIAGSSDSQVAGERIAGFRAAMLKHVGQPDALVVRGGYSHDAGREAMECLLDSGERPTAVFCVNDAAALGAIQGCRRRGLRIPEDISIVGVDDIELAAASDPPLTTVHQNRYEIGASAMRMLIGLLQRRQLADTDVVVPVELVVRQSTAPPR